MKESFHPSSPSSSSSATSSSCSLLPSRSSFPYTERLVGVLVRALNVLPTCSDMELLTAVSNFGLAYVQKAPDLVMRERAIEVLSPMMVGHMSSAAGTTCASVLLEFRKMHRDFEAYATGLPAALRGAMTAGLASAEQNRKVREAKKTGEEEGGGATSPGSADGGMAVTGGVAGKKKSKKKGKKKGKKKKKGAKTEDLSIDFSAF